MSQAAWSSSVPRPRARSPRRGLSRPRGHPGGRRVYYGTLADIATSLEDASKAGWLSQGLKTLVFPSLLVVDEIAYPPISRTGAMLFFQLLSRRYECAAPVLTSNKASVAVNTECQTKVGSGCVSAGSSAPLRCTLHQLLWVERDARVTHAAAHAPGVARRPAESRKAASNGAFISALIGVC